jgi:Xaa-Pro aminopeptidase
MNQFTAFDSTRKTLSSVYAERRARLLSQMGEDSIALITTSPTHIRNRDAEYRFRADSSFYYLTGFAEPEAVAFIQPKQANSQTASQASSQVDVEYGLFCRERHREREIWDGLRAGTAGAVAVFGAEVAYNIDDLDEWIPKLLAGKKRLYVRLGNDSAFDLKVSQWLKNAVSNQRQGGSVPVEIIQLDSLLDEMRLIKDSHEIDIMRNVAQISAHAHIRAMQTIRPDMMEYALEAELLYEFTRNGCQTAYNSIVGGGANGCILHYIENNAPLKQGDLVLIDAGGELDHYAADITRTFPVGGVFSPEQSALYQLVLDAQLAAIDAVQVGASCKHYDAVAVRVLTEGLVGLGLLKLDADHPDIDALIQSGAHRRFYMHGTGHWLGMDVHDVGAYKVGGDWRPLQAGMVLTVEPGLYVALDDETVEARWRGIGIRIEDDVLVTANGPDVLTRDVPKDIAEIEKLMQEGRVAW